MIATDDALDVLELLVKDLLSCSVREGKKERLRTLKDLDAAALQLSQVGRVLLDPNCDDEKVREKVWRLLTKEQLTEAVTQVEELARPPDDNYYQELLGRWRQVRRFLPTLLLTIEFLANKAGQPILAAWRFLQSIEGQTKPSMNNAPLQVVGKSWVRWVVLEDGRIDRRSYTFCILEQLVEGLCRRDLFVSPSERWSNPQAKLLQGRAWESARSHVCRALNLDPTPVEELNALRQQLDEAYSRTANNLPNNAAVRIEVTKGSETLTISNLDKLTDTSGYSDVVFGLFWLLGYQFSPRLADVGEARFWRLDTNADYGVLDKLARQRVKTQLIEQNWDDLLRVAGSLKLGTVSAQEIMRALQLGKKPSTLAKAIGELGRVAKTLYLLNYVDDEAYRRRILTQLNRGEGRHSLSRAIFYGRRGEVRQRYREGQEEQLSALGLVVNVLVLWNTYYMNTALNHLRTQGTPVKAEDVGRLSPLAYSHINMLGRYHFNLPSELLDGGMRPLRDLNDSSETWVENLCV